jgi:transcriptional regulator with XRE-family HTH domain
MLVGRKFGAVEPGSASKHNLGEAGPEAKFSHSLADFCFAVREGIFPWHRKNISNSLAGSEGSWFPVTVLPSIFHEKARHHLRVLMKDQGHSARTLAIACGLSRSLVEKLMSQESQRPSPQAVIKIEDALSSRIWSSPSAFKARKQTAKWEARVRSLAQVEGLGLEAARAKAAQMFPALSRFASNQPTPMHHAHNS